MGELVPSGTTVDQLHKARAEAAPSEPEVVEYVGNYFKTVVKNSRDGDQQIQTDSGGPWLFLPAGREITLCSWSPKTMYCPFSKIVFEKNGKVSVTRRFNFKEPVEEAPFSILLDNRDGAEMEVVRINDEYVSVLKGIPRRVAIPLHDCLVIYKAIRWVRRTVKEPFPGNRNYLTTRTIIEKVPVPRKASEIRAIKRLLEKEAVNEARRSAARRFGGVIGGPEGDDAETEGQAD